MLSEQELIEKCICGDRLAQKQLYEKYNALFYAVCLRYMPTTAEAEDAMIMGFTTIFAKMDTFREEGSFEGWMRRIVINTAISILRLDDIHYEMEHGDMYIENRAGTEEVNMTYSHIYTKDILAQIRRLPAGYRTVFNLYAIDGYSYDEIALILKLNKGTVRSQLAKARKTLQKKLAAYR